MLVLVLSLLDGVLVLRDDRGMPWRGAVEVVLVEGRRRQRRVDLWHWLVLKGNGGPLALGTGRLGCRVDRDRRLAGLNHLRPLRIRRALDGGGLGGQGRDLAGAARLTLGHQFAVGGLKLGLLGHALLCGECAARHVVVWR